MNTMLKSLGCLATGNTPSKKVIRYWNSNDIPFIKPADLKENSIEMLSCGSDFISHEAEGYARIAKKDTVLVTCIGIIGKVGIVTNENVAFNQQLTSITPNQSLVYPRYLAWNLVANKKRLQSMSNAPVVPIINKTQLSEFEIKVEQDLNTQRKISQVLDCIEHQLNLHFHKLEILDNLVKSRFVEMFGGTVFSKAKLPDMVWFQEGPGVRKYQYTSSGVKLLNVANLHDGKLDLSNTNRFISKEEAYGRYKHFLVDSGDLIIASSGIKVESFDKKIGFVSKEHLPLCMNTSTIRFKVLDKSALDIIYFEHFLKSTSFKRQLERQITGSAQLNFGPSHLKKMWVDVPPLALQQEFAAFVAQVDKLRFEACYAMYFLWAAFTLL